MRPLLFIVCCLLVFSCHKDLNAIPKIDKELVIQPYVICNNQGELCGYYQDSEAYLDKVYSQAGIDVKVLIPIQINSPVGGITLEHPLHGELRVGKSLDPVKRMIEIIEALQSDNILPSPVGGFESPIEVFYLS
jgi:hypothetical protein